jgi:hypothetical protein
MAKPYRWGDVTPPAIRKIRARSELRKLQVQNDELKKQVAKINPAQLVADAEKLLELAYRASEKVNRDLRSSKEAA